jgi:flagellar motor component MotA
VGGLLAGFTLDGGNPMSLVGIPALIIILTGTVGAVTVATSLREVLRVPSLIMQSMQRVAGPSPQLAQQLLEFAEKARRDGILSLEDTVEDLEDDMLRKGLRLVVDGTESEILVEVLESDLSIMEQRKMEDAVLRDHGGAQFSAFKPALAELGLHKPLMAVRNTRKIGKRDMIHNDLTPAIEVDPETYVVKADGVVLACEPARVLPMAQRYFLF